MQLISWETGNGEGFTAPREGLQAQTRILLHTGTSLLLRLPKVQSSEAVHSSLEAQSIPRRACSPLPCTLLVHYWPARVLLTIVREEYSV
jgi:hypothetical protein